MRFTFASIAFLVFAFPLTARTEELSPREIADKASESGTPAAIRQKTTMTLSGKDGKDTRKRSMTIERKGLPGKDSMTRIAFHEPKDVAGTVLLSLEKGKDRVQHLWLPGVKRVRRIAGAQRSGAFMGSDFSFEDLAGRSLDDYELTALPDETVAGKPAYVVQAVPKKGAETSYAKTISSIAKEDFLTLRVRFFDAKGSELKVLEVDPEKVKREGTIRVPLRLEMTTLKDGHKTVLETTEAEIDPKLDESLFDPKNLDPG